jgi:hypothetical protein
MKLKRIAALSAVVLLSFGMVSCGDGGGKDNSESSVVTQAEDFTSNAVNVIEDETESESAESETEESSAGESETVSESESLSSENDSDSTVTTVTTAKKADSAADKVEIEKTDYDCDSFSFSIDESVWTGGSVDGNSNFSFSAESGAAISLYYISTEDTGGLSLDDYAESINVNYKSADEAVANVDVFTPTVMNGKKAYKISVTMTYDSQDEAIKTDRYIVEANGGFVVVSFGGVNNAYRISSADFSAVLSTLKIKA